MNPPSTTTPTPLASPSALASTPATNPTPTPSAPTTTDFLSSTGLAKRFGIDIQSVDFWRSSLDVIRGQIGDFERLVE